MSPVELVPQGNTAGFLLAVGFVVVQAGTEQQVGGLVVEAGLAKDRAVGAAVLGELAGALNLVHYYFRADDEFMHTGGQGVFPARRPVQRVEHAGVGTERLLFVPGFRELDTGAPVVTGHGLQVKSHGTDQEVGVTPLEFGIALGLEHRQPDTAALAKLVTDFCQPSGIAKPLILATGPQVSALGIGINPAGQKRRLPLPRGHAGRGFKRLVGATGQFRPALAARFWLKGKSLDDTAHRISPIQGTFRTAYQFDPLHQFRRQKLPGRDAGGG